MKLNKKYIKNLSKGKKTLPLEQTHNVAGGTSGTGNQGGKPVMSIILGSGGGTTGGKPA